MSKWFNIKWHMALWKKNFLIYTTTWRKHRQIPLVNSYYTVNEWCATFDSHNALLSVQIVKYSSFEVWLYLTMNWAGHLGIEGSYCFLLNFSYSQLFIKFPRCPKEAETEIFEHLRIFWNSHTYSSTGNI